MKQVFDAYKKHLGSDEEALKKTTEKQLRRDEKIKTFSIAYEDLSSLTPPLVVTEHNQYAQTASALCKSFTHHGFAILRLSSDERAILDAKRAADTTIFGLPSHTKSQIAEHSTISPTKEQLHVNVIGLARSSADSKDDPSLKAFSLMQRVSNRLANVLSGRFIKIYHLGSSPDDTAHKEHESPTSGSPGFFDDFVESPPFEEEPESKLTSFLYTGKKKKSSARSKVKATTSSVGAEPHKDRGLFTLISAPPNSGLEVMDCFGVWKQADKLVEHPSDLIVLPGATLDEALCGVGVACYHRVVIRGSSAANNSRLSICYRARAPLKTDARTLGLNIDIYGNGSWSSCSTKTMKDWNILWDQTHRSINSSKESSSSSSNSSDGGNAPPAKRQKLDDNRKAVVEKAEHKYKERTESLKRDAKDIGIGFFASMKTVDPERVKGIRYILVGDRVLETDYRTGLHTTAGFYELEDGDQIDAVLEQCGD